MGWLFGTKQQLEQLKQQMDVGNYEEALSVADGISDFRLKNYADLMLVAKVYKKNGEYSQAKQLYEKSREKRSSRAVLLELLDCCLETKETEDADRYFDELHKTAPDDTALLYAYRYKIEKCKKRDAALLITILEELKAIDYTEEYAYELAKQYHKAGKTRECMQECEEIILWFAEGAIVERAKTLLAYYKGEISLEEIKTVGERYAANRSMKNNEEPKEQTEQALEKPFPKEKEVVQEEAVQEEALQEEKRQWEMEEEPLPEIDLSCLDFSEEEQNTSREPYELFFLENPENRREASEEKPGKAERLLVNRNVSIEETCKSFARIGAVRSQILECLERFLNEQGSMSLVIAGEEKSGKTALALSMVKLLYQLRLLKYDRTAVIAAERLNEISVADKKQELKNCNLLIERAGKLQTDTLEELFRFLGSRNKGICLILEDTAECIDRLLHINEGWEERLHNQIRIPDYTAEDLLGFAYDRIEAEDYAIDKPAAEALKEKIEEIVSRREKEQHLTLTLSLVEQALSLAEQRNGQIILKMAAAGRFQTGNFFVLLEEDIDACDV